MASEKKLLVWMWTSIVLLVLLTVVFGVVKSYLGTAATVVYWALSGLVALSTMVSMFILLGNRR